MTVGLWSGFFLRLRDEEHGFGMLMPVLLRAVAGTNSQWCWLSLHFSTGTSHGGKRVLGVSVCVCVCMHVYIPLPEELIRLAVGL